MATGFASSQSFARAFRRAHGVTPSSYRDGASLPDRVPDDAVIDIVWRESTVLVARRAEGRPYARLNDLFQEVWDWAEQRRFLPALRGLYGVPLDDPESVPLDQLRYEAGLDLGGEHAETPFVSVVLPAGRYARLSRRGSYDRLQPDTQTLVGAWLPASGEEPADFPAFHHFLNDPEETAEADLETHVLLPLAP
jgi:AraC family transcriptional regulator